MDDLGGVAETLKQAVGKRRKMVARSGAAVKRLNGKLTAHSGGKAGNIHELIGYRTAHGAPYAVIIPACGIFVEQVVKICVKISKRCGRRGRDAVRIKAVYIPFGITQHNAVPAEIIALSVALLPAGEHKAALVVKVAPAVAVEKAAYKPVITGKII